MADQELSRKLAVIVHADVVDSTALVQRNETLAHKLINAAFQRFSSIIEQYGGTVHEMRGDALVAEFARPSDAVCAALRFQQSNTGGNTPNSDETMPRVRVGIAIGEEVFAHGTVTGAGVMLAQRVEQLSEPGGVCVTAAIHEAIPQRPYGQHRQATRPDCLSRQGPERPGFAWAAGGDGILTSQQRAKFSFHTFLFKPALADLL
jgi:adenylate cyclase